MNITRQNIDDLNAVLKLQLEKNDYEERVSKILKDYRKKANIPGFRPGNVPISLIKKMYYKPVLVEEINKIVGEKITAYLKDENISALGDPLPNETENKPVDWENDTEFEFVFDLGLAPSFDLNISKKDKIKVYDINLEDKMIDNYIDNYTRRFGRYVDTDVIQDNELVKGDIAECDAKGIPVNEGIKAEESTIYLEIIKDENEKKAFVGKKLGDIVVFDLKKAFPNNTEIASILKVDKDKVEAAGSFYQFTVKSVMRFEKAEANQELFDKVYGADVIKTEEDFRKKISDEISSALKSESNYKFLIDTRDYFLKKYDLKLPDAFLKRWLKFMNEGKLTDEQIEKEYPLFEENMKWQLIKNKVVKEANIEVKEDQVVEYAKEVTRNQFKQYGLNNVPDEQIDSYSVNLLKKEADVRKMVDKLLEDKVLEYIKENITEDVKPISSEDFGKLFNEK
jgi:trigger factor